MTIKINAFELNDDTWGLSLYRKLIAVAGGVYLLWWFAVHYIYPTSFNPLGSRLAVVGAIFAALGSTFKSSWARQNIRTLFIASLWLITAHYYYLFLGNAGDMNWVVGCYITVVAICLGFHSKTALLLYSVFVLLLSVLLTVLIPSLLESVFFLGLATILLQANLGLRSRLSNIKNLKESNERFQQVFNSAIEGMLVHENGRIVIVNEALAKMFGYSPTELIGRNLEDMVQPEEQAAVAKNIKMREVDLRELKGRSKTGELVETETQSTTINFGRRSAKLVTVQDIADRKRADREAENLRIRDEFITIASHELKTPLTSLKLQLQILDHDARSGQFQNYSEEKITSALALFLRQVDRLADLVDSMLDVSRISANRLILERKTFDFSEVVRELAAPYANAMDLDLELPLTISGDLSRIEQVVNNLFSNAVKFGERKMIHVRTYRDGNSALLTVVDQGIGISQDYGDKIFGRFERAPSAHNIGGLGLGLFISRSIIEAHGGEITYTSTLGKGSCFTVRLPLINPLSQERPL